MPALRSLSLVLLGGVLGCVAGRDPRPDGVDSVGPSSASNLGSSDSPSGPSPSPSSSSGMASASASAEETTASAGPVTTDTRGPDPTSASTGPASSVCDDVAGEPLIVPTTCDGPSGNTSTEIPSNGLFSTSWFGCYMEDDGTIHEDPFDNCEFACGSRGLCPAGQDGPTCEANLRWFAADADRYGCGGRIRVTNCDNGNAVVLVTLDRGPNCRSVEMTCDTPVLDMSHDAMVYLFDGSTYGGCEHQAVVVEAVDATTPLGPV